MRVIVYIFLTVLLFFFSCKKNKNTTKDYPELNKDTIVYKGKKITNWLQKHQVSIDSINIVKRKFVLWEMNHDSSKISHREYINYPSPDSLFMLMTNYNNTGDRIDSSHDWKLIFINMNTNVDIGGMMIVDSLQEERLNHLWYDNKTLLLLRHDLSKDQYLTMKLKMNVDSVWYYPTYSTISN